MKKRIYCYSKADGALVWGSFGMQWNLHSCTDPYNPPESGLPHFSLVPSTTALPSPSLPSSLQDALLIPPGCLHNDAFVLAPSAWNALFQVFLGWKFSDWSKRCLIIQVSVQLSTSQSSSLPSKVACLLPHC